MRELFDGYLCLLDACDKPLIDGMPPCSDCDKCISVEDAANQKEE